MIVLSCVVTASLGTSADPVSLNDSGSGFLSPGMTRIMTHLPYGEAEEFFL